MISCAHLSLEFHNLSILQAGWYDLCYSLIKLAGAKSGITNSLDVKRKNKSSAEQVVDKHLSSLFASASSRVVLFSSVVFTAFSILSALEVDGIAVAALPGSTCSFYSHQGGQLNVNGMNLAHSNIMSKEHARLIK